MSFLTPAYPFDPALIEAARPVLPPRGEGSAREDEMPLVLGGVLRRDSPFLDAMPFDLIGAPPLPAEFGEDVAEAELPPAPFDRAAVERASARAADRAARVEASVWSDDGLAEHVCDVSAWLAGATVREITALARAGWTGDEAAELAATLAEDDPEVDDVLRHARRADAELAVEVDGRAAMAWLARHRPAVAAAVTDGASDDADED